MNNVRYIIKVTAKAKNNNPNFAGKTNVYWYGKGQMLLAILLEDSKGSTVEIMTLTNYCIEHYGYKRMHDAIYAAKFWDEYNEDSKSYWTYRTEIISKEF